MNSLNFDDLQKLNHTIEEIYSLDDLDTFGVRAIDIVDRLMFSDLVTFHIVNLSKGQVSDFFSPDFPRLTTEMEQVRKQYFYEHPIVRHMSISLNRVSAISDFVTQKELHAMEGIYHQFLRVAGIEDQMILCTPKINDVNSSYLSREDKIVVSISLNNEKWSFANRDRLFLNLLRPHLFQAYSNAQKYQQLQQQVERMSEIVLDPQGRVRSIYPQASMLLDKYFPTRNYPGQFPTSLWDWVQNQVEYLVDRDLPTASIPLQIQQHHQQLTIRLIIKQDEDRYLLLLEEQSVSLLDSLQLLGLSDRETEVLAKLIRGKDNQSIAIDLNISISTVRKHLENIYHRLKVTSRTEAIAKTLEILNFL